MFVGIAGRLIVKILPGKAVVYLMLTRARSHFPIPMAAPEGVMYLFFKSSSERRPKIVGQAPLAIAPERRQSRNYSGPEVGFGEIMQ